MNELLKYKIELDSKPIYLNVTKQIGVSFFELFKEINDKFSTSFILESLGKEDFDSRYSIIGLDPEMIIESKSEKILTINGEDISVPNSYYALRDIVPQNLISKNYAGGLIGYLSYEAINLFENVINLKVDENFGLFKFGVYKDGFVYDRYTGDIFYFYYKKNKVKNYNRLNKILTIVKQDAKNEELTEVEKLGDSMTKNEHKEMIGKIKKEIVKGNTFQCQGGFKTRYKIKGRKINIYEKLREVNPSPYSYFLKFDNNYIIGASPENLFRLRDGEMETFPLAGTIKRGENEKDDRKLTKKLLTDPKEIAEHNMLIDLHRNDIGRVARIGTCKVRRLKDIKKFSHVQHISSEIVGIIRPEKDMFDGLASLFPAGTLTGAPKIESIKIIEKNEKVPRGGYGGVVGHFSYNGDCTFAIAIRTLFISEVEAYSQTSGGIVYDSDPEKEYEEIKNKLKAMDIVMNNFTTYLEK